MLHLWKILKKIVFILTVYVTLLLTSSVKTSDNVIMSILSMGMTNDYEVAIEEGSTMVRVGTGLFGARNYNQV